MWRAPRLLVPTGARCLALCRYSFRNMCTPKVLCKLNHCVVALFYEDLLHFFVSPCVRGQSCGLSGMRSMQESCDGLSTMPAKDGTRSFGFTNTTFNKAALQDRKEKMDSPNVLRELIAAQTAGRAKHCQRTSKLSNGRGHPCLPRRRLWVADADSHRLCSSPHGES